MTLTTVFAENVRPRVPIGIEDPRTHQIVFGAAYKGRVEGTMIFAFADKRHLEVPNRTRVTVTYDPAADGAVGLRWCHNCETKHLRRIGPDASASASCDARDLIVRAARKDARKGNGQTFTAAKKEQKKVEQAERINAAIERQRLSRDDLVAAGLRGTAKHYPIDHPFFARQAAAHGLTVEQATALIGA